MKGILFAGCSFTWGQGLYYYSKLSTLREPPPNEYIADIVTPAHIRYMQTIRWPRLVANNFKTFEVVSKVNGGSEDNSMDFIRQAFGLINNRQHFINETFSFSEIEYVIIQTSQVNRNSYEYVNKNGVKKDFNIYDSSKKNDFYEWLVEVKKWSLDDWLIDHTKTKLNSVKELMLFLEENGVKTKILSWEPDYLPYIKSDEWLNERFISLEYNGINYDCIRHLMNTNQGFTINDDYNYFMDPPKDHHPSLRCHEVIAKNVIKSLYPFGNENINDMSNIVKYERERII